jgi:hypothetical protein
MDTHGNVYVVESNVKSQSKAEQIAEEFNSRGHKQHFWFESRPDADSGVALSTDKPVIEPVQLDSIVFKSKEQSPTMLIGLHGVFGSFYCV